MPHLPSQDPTRVCRNIRCRHAWLLNTMPSARHGGSAAWAAKCQHLVASPLHPCLPASPPAPLLPSVSHPNPNLNPTPITITKALPPRARPRRPWPPPGAASASSSPSRSFSAFFTLQARTAHEAASRSESYHAPRSATYSFPRPHASLCACKRSQRVPHARAYRLQTLPQHAQDPC